MSAPLLATKLYIPPPRPNFVMRQRLIERLEAGLDSKLTLVSAPAGFGKTTLLSGWLTGSRKAAAWLSLDDSDNDIRRFLGYFVAALQTIKQDIGQEVLGMTQSPQPPVEAILTALLNDLQSISEKLILVLDDYHLIHAQILDKLLSFLLDYLPPQIHLVIATREDPDVPLARLRARNQLNELRPDELRFRFDETSQFLNQVMALQLSKDEIAALENRTEGWIAGLQLAALSLQGHQDSQSFIQSFTGNNRFVLDYLLEEVLQQQPEAIQRFLLQTSILERLSAPLCNALNHELNGQETLEYIERANLFIVPLDKERRWYRYHHLFADLLRQRLHETSTENSISELHQRASRWYEENSLEIEAFHHAAAANDIDNAIRLIEGKGMPLPFRGAVIPVLNWLESLPETVLDSRPLLWAWFASVLSAAGQQNQVEAKIQAAERALEGRELNEETRDLIGRLAAVRATHAADQGLVERIISQSQRALEYLHPRNLAFRTSTMWKMGYAYHLLGERAAARRAYSEVISIGEVTRNMIFTSMAVISLGNLQEKDNQLRLAVENYQRGLQAFGEHPLPMACEAYLGLARIYCEWNDLATAEGYIKKGAQLAKGFTNTDRFAVSQLILTRLKLAQGDIDAVAELLSKTGQLIHQAQFKQLMPELNNLQITHFLQQGNLKAASHLLNSQETSPLNRARLYLAQGDNAAALELLEAFHQEMKAKAWLGELLRAMLLQSLTYHAIGEKEASLNILAELLPLAEQEAFIRLFLDEGLPMAQLLFEAAKHGLHPVYIAKLLAFFETGKKASPPTLIEALSERELEVLRLIADGLSNQEISERLFLALSTVKGHNQTIFGKLQVQRRTEAVARARELGLL